MAESKNSYKIGEKVPETGNYYCEICHTEGGVEGRELRKGDEFPVCMNCGEATSWKKVHKHK